MSRGSEQTFFQRRYTDGQQVHEQVLNIINHQGNENQNHNEVSPHTCQNGHHQKDKITSIAEDVEKRELLCTAGGNVNWCSHYGNSMEVRQKIKTELAYDPAIPLLGIYLKKMKTPTQKDTCIPKFTAALFTTAKIWKRLT